MRIAIVGCGHVGLVAAVGLADLGHDVAAVDSDPEKVALLRGGRAPFYEPGLQELLTDVVSGRRLTFGGEIAEVVAEAEVVFICVGTPTAAGGEANMVAVEHAAGEIALHASDGVVIVEKSTVPAGTGGRLSATIRRSRPDLRFDVVSNPEFLREGHALRDFLEPDRILIGADTDRGHEVMRLVYEPLVRRGRPLIAVDTTTAELAKHACNAFLALKISFANALARICELATADVAGVVEVMGSDPRIGGDFLRAGMGYGGYCFPKDLLAFERVAEGLGYRFPLLSEIARINEEAVNAILGKARDALWNVEGKRIALLGLAYKPGTDDVRFSPALSLARALASEGGRVVGYDPKAEANAKAEAPEIETASSPYDAVDGAHCLVLCTEWEEFRDLDLRRVRSLMVHPIVIDGRNFFDGEVLRGLGFAHYPVGRPAALP